MYHIRLADGKNVVASSKQHDIDNGPPGKLPKKQHGDYSDFGPAGKLSSKQHGDYQDSGPPVKLEGLDIFHFLLFSCPEQLNR